MHIVLLLSFSLLGAMPTWAAEPLSPERAEQVLQSLPLPPAPAELVGVSGASLRRSAFLPLLGREASSRGLPFGIAEAVAEIESGYYPNAKGVAGEVGLMQLMPSTAALLGFGGTLLQLAEPETNIRLGVQYLAEAWRRAGGDLCRALMKYRAGHGQEMMSARSIEYCRRARVYMARLGSPIDSESAPTQAALTPQVRVSEHTILRRDSLSAEQKSRRFWQAHEARIRLLTQQLHAKWNRGKSRGS